MKYVNDRIRAKRLLEAREHGFAPFPFFRRNAPRYLLYSIPFAIVLGLLAFRNLWCVFGMVVSFLIGLGCCYFRWYNGQRRVWPFARKVINWDIVKKLSEDEDEPSA